VWAKTKKKVLVVDDEPLICESMRMILNCDGHEMEEAHSGQAALDKLDRHVFDIIFTDFFMPGMKGDQLAQAIRRRNDATPIIMDSLQHLHLRSSPELLVSPLTWLRFANP
jgi:CheY-like chemotaxis protein